MKDTNSATRFHDTSACTSLDALHTIGPAGIC